MVTIDRDAPRRFLHTAYHADDWVAVLLKSHEIGKTTQRVVPVSLLTDARFQAWLRAMNAAHANVFVSVNAMAHGQRSRTRAALGAIRHIFLDADHDARSVLASVKARADLPPLSYVLHSSPHRAHLLWRVTGFTPEAAEALQKQLARQLGTDIAATPSTQTTRLPGFMNHKYRPGHLVTIEYRAPNRVCTPTDFPMAMETPSRPESVRSTARRSRTTRDALQRARRYIAALPPAISGHHGDLHTFRVCCRLVRGFALNDADALHALREWNVRCKPPWSERELRDKLRRARRYGGEPIGGLLTPPRADLDLA
jgi:hypothetical protein